MQPAAALTQLLHKLHPDLVRIPIYWSAVSPSAEQLDFASVDQLLATVATSNQSRHARQTKLILVAGVRNLAYPEVHLPAWLDYVAPLDLAHITSSDAYRPYLTASFQRSAASARPYPCQLQNGNTGLTNPGTRGCAL